MYVLSYKLCESKLDLTGYYELNVCVPPKIVLKTLPPNAMVLGCGAFGKYLGLDEGMKVKSS